jgi:hypothetical protein
MPKVKVKSLRSLASKCNPSILTSAIIESADYIEGLEYENEMLWKWVKQSDEPLSEDEMKNVSNWIYHKLNA